MFTWQEKDAMTPQRALAAMVVFFTLAIQLASAESSLPTNCGEAAPSTDADDWIRHADCLRQAGDPRAALAVYERAGKLESQCSRSRHYGMGLAYEDLDLGEEAHAAFLEAQKCGRLDADLLYHLGIAREIDNRYDEALVYFRRASELDAGDNRIQRNIGFVLTRQGHDEDAIPFFLEAIHLDQNDHKAWHNLGVTYSVVEEGIREELRGLSLESREGTVETDNPIEQRIQGLNRKLKAFDWFDEAVKALRESVRLEPRQPLYWYTLGTTLKDRRELLPEAVDALSEAVSLKPDYYEALRNLTINQERLGRFEEAHATGLHLARVAGPGDIWLEVHLADLETKLGDWATAEKRYQRALAAGEANVDAHMGLAIVYRHLSRKDASDAHLRRAIELRPDLKRLFEHAVESAP